jgi:hypothetical protein
MKEVEFTSELICAMIFGLPNGKKIIKDTYKKYDDGFEYIELIENRFAITLEECKIILDGNIKEMEFKRAPLFYSLFIAVYDLKFGLKTTSGEGKEINNENLANVQTELYNINSTVSSEEEYDEYLAFSHASKSSTDKLANRQLRHDLLLEVINPLYV